MLNDFYDADSVVIRPVDETAVYMSDGEYFVIAQTTVEEGTRVIKLENKHQVREVIMALENLLSDVE